MNEGDTSFGANSIGTNSIGTNSIGTNSVGTGSVGNSPVDTKDLGAGSEPIISVSRTIFQPRNAPTIASIGGSPPPSAC